MSRKQTAPFVLAENSTNFPPPKKALANPNGLLAIGGDLSSDRLLDAYKKGIFPWFDKGSPLLWWSPNPREILIPQDIKITKSLAKTMKKGFTYSFDTVFDKVITLCAAPRKNQKETWIDNRMQDAYQKLHQLGYAHSFEVWQEKQLVGGLYGVSLGHAFFGESMFNLVNDGAKIAFVQLAMQLQHRNFDFIDCQIPNPFLKQMGSISIVRSVFLEKLTLSLHYKTHVGPWYFHSISKL